MNSRFSSTVLLAMMVNGAVAFAPIRITHATRRLSMADIGTDIETTQKVEDVMEAHEELMYTLGIN